MGKDMFMVRVDLNHHLGRKDYVVGNIADMLYDICDGETNGTHAHEWNTELNVLTIPVVCKPRQMKEAKRLIDKRYPEVCVFDEWVQ